MTELTVADFRQYFGSLFADVQQFPDSLINMQLDEAKIEVVEDIFKKYYRRAAFYLTAHFLTLFNDQQQSMASDSSGSVSAGPRGVVSSVSVGDLSLTMEMPEYSVSSDDKFLASTIYGQEFIRIRNKMSRGPLLARTPYPPSGAAGGLVVGI